MAAEAARYTEAMTMLESCPVPREQLMAEKADIYQQLAEVNRRIRAERKKLALCQDIQDRLPKMARTIEKLEKKEVIHDEHRRR